MCNIDIHIKYISINKKLKICKNITTLQLLSAEEGQIHSTEY